MTFLPRSWCAKNMSSVQIEAAAFSQPCEKIKSIPLFATDGALSRSPFTVPETELLIEHSGLPNLCLSFSQGKASVNTPVFKKPGNNNWAKFVLVRKRPTELSRLRTSLPAASGSENVVSSLLRRWREGERGVFRLSDAGINVGTRHTAVALYHRHICFSSLFLSTDFSFLLLVSLRRAWQTRWRKRNRDGR